MCTVVLVLSCWACVGQSMRVQRSMLDLQRSSSAEQQKLLKLSTRDSGVGALNPLNALVCFLLSNSAVVGWLAASAGGQAVPFIRTTSPRCAEWDGNDPPKQVFTFPDGSTYCGDIANGRMCGQGEWRSVDGSSYVGSFLDDVFHGYGKYTDAARNQYVGEFQSSSMHGTGTYMYSDGRAEVGTYHQGSDVQGVRWSPNRSQAWRLDKGQVVGEISLADAAAFAASLSLVVPPSIFELAGLGQARLEQLAELDSQDGDAPDWQRNWLQLAAWIEVYGGTTEPVECAKFGDGLRGMRATRAIDKGEVVCVMPMACCHDYASNEKGPASKLWLDFEPDLPTYGRLALGLLYERGLGRDSRKAAYIATLPSIEEVREAGPLEMWEPDEVALCESLKFVAKQRRDSLATSPLLSNASLRAKCWQDLKLLGEPPSREDVLWSLACVLSRSMDEIGMYPIDFFNHKLPNNAELVLATDRSCVLVKAIRVIGAGEQVFISYGMHPNMILLSQYGFMQESNPIGLTLMFCGKELASLLPGYVDDTVTFAPDGTVAEWQAAGPNMQAALEKLGVEGKLPKALLAEAQREWLLDGTAVYALLLQRTLASYSPSAVEARSAIEREGSAMKSRRRLALTLSCEQQDMLGKELDRLNLDELE